MSDIINDKYAESTYKITLDGITSTTNYYYDPYNRGIFVNGINYYPYTFNLTQTMQKEEEENDQYKEIVKDIKERNSRSDYIVGHLPGQ